MTPKHNFVIYLKQKSDQVLFSKEKSNFKGLFSSYKIKEQES